jgi:diaminopimelate epimerase
LTHKRSPILQLFPAIPIWKSKLLYNIDLIAELYLRRLARKKAFNIIVLMRTLNIVKADPAGNITIFVLNGQDLGPRERTDAAKRLLDDKTLGAEQVGFVFEPAGDNDLWRLTMMGGEFCGNAARSFGLFAARKMGLHGKQHITVEVSGAAHPVDVELDCETGDAAASIPPPRASSFLPSDDASGGASSDGELPVYQFDGITHVIAKNTDPNEASFFKIKKLLERQNGEIQDALGVMFYSTAENMMRPAVYVRATGTLIFESSCGSGTAAFACHHFADKTDGENIVPVRQPGGTITARVIKQNREVKQIWIGGRVTLAVSS